MNKILESQKSYKLSLTFQQLEMFHQMLKHKGPGLRGNCLWPVYTAIEAELNPPGSSYKEKSQWGIG